MLTLSLLALAAPARLLAQSIPSPYRYIEASQSVSLFGAYLWTGEDEADVAPESMPLLGALYAIRFTGPLSGIVSLAGGTSSRTVYTAAGSSTATDFTLVPLGDAEFYVLLAEAGLRFHLTGPRTWRGIAPYAGITAGLVTDLGDDNPFDEAVPEDERVDFGPGFAVGVSAGTEWFPTERISLRLDVRDYVWRIQIPLGLRAEEVEDTEWTQNLGLSLGAAFHF